MVSTLNISIMIFNILFSIAIPIGLAIYFKKKYQTSLKAFFIGCATWFLFAMVLEQILHTVVLLSPIGKTIQENMWMYAIYGGLAAGLFEETGRFLAMKYVLKNEYDNRHNALMYGAGHGGFEAMFLLGTGMINYVVYAVLINTNQTETLLAPLNDEQRVAMEQIFTALPNVKTYELLLGDMERISAVILHIALSVIVWFAVTNRKTIWYPVAILLHALADGWIVIISKLGVPTVIVEVFILASSLCVAFIAWKVWKSNQQMERVDE